jgi:hypothetical protein
VIDVHLRTIAEASVKLTHYKYRKNDRVKSLKCAWRIPAHISILNYDLFGWVTKSVLAYRNSSLLLKDLLTDVSASVDSLLN